MSEPTWRERMLASIPPEVLWVRGRSKRVGALAAWCEARRFRPTLAELEEERARRRSADLDRPAHTPHTDRRGRPDRARPTRARGDRR